MPRDPPGGFVHHGAFGNERFGVTAERFARFFGTPRFIIGQTALVVIWIALNAGPRRRYSARARLRDPPDRSTATRTRSR